MKTLLSEQELIEFENDIADCFNNKMIKAPIHLHFGNEKQLIEIFKEVQEDHWVISSWRSHYHCLLKGYSKELMKQHILDGRSIEMCNKDLKIFSSAIVSGNISIALGIAMDIKRKNQTNKVWCFVGDMTSLSGQFWEAHEYAFNFDLPITFVIEDNGKSVCTNTLKVWNYLNHPWGDDEGLITNKDGITKWSDKLYYYKYDGSKYQHAGTNIRVQF